MWVLSIAETIEIQPSVLYFRRSITMQNRQLSPSEYLEAYSPNSVVHFYTAIIIILYTVVVTAGSALYMLLKMG